ncbi:MAG: zonular occludens toxin domain-containing protein [Mucilaginibacter sp.]
MLIDEAQFVFPKALTAKQVQSLDYPGGVEAAAKAGKPPDFLTAFDMHRHYNWDMVLTTPCISKIRSDIRDAAEGAFKHRNSAMVGLKGRYREGFHSAEETGKSDSDIITNRGRKIKPFVWKLYASTATGDFTDTTAGLSLLQNPKILFLFSLLCLMGGYGLYSPAPKPLRQAFGAGVSAPVSSVPGNSSSSVPAAVVPAGPTVPVDSHRVGARTAAPLVPVATSPAPSDLPYKDFQFRLLGSTVWKNAYHIHIQATTDTRKVMLSDADLVAAGYQWRLISPCHAILTFAGVDYPVYCSQPAVPSGQPVIDTMHVASNLIR